MTTSDLINIRQALRVYQKVCDHGQKQDDRYVFNGLTASSDFDGYTIFLSSSDVTLTVFFHNKYNIEHKNRMSLEQFIEKIEKTDRLDVKA